MYCLTKPEFLTVILMSVFIGLGIAAIAALYRRLKDGKHTY